LRADCFGWLVVSVLWIVGVGAEFIAAAVRDSARLLARA
jgi:hypothetical protein